MTYNELLAVIKTLFIERLDRTVPLLAYQSSPNITESNYLDTIYTDIMALGYNFNDKEKAFVDIYEIQSALHGESQSLIEQIKGRINETANLYQNEIKVFSGFHKKTQNGEDFDKVIEYIKKELEIY